jgi:hypothetical protein
MATLVIRRYHAAHKANRALRVAAIRASNDAYEKAARDEADRLAETLEQSTEVAVQPVVTSAKPSSPAPQQQNSQNRNNHRR